MPEPIPGAGTVGGVGDVMSIPLSLAYAGNRAPNGVDQTEALLQIAQLLGSMPLPPTNEAFDGNKVMGPGVDENFVYQPRPYSRPLGQRDR
jgi:hypothetical protein